MISFIPLNEAAEVIRGVTFASEQSVTEEFEDYLPVIRAGNISEKLELHDDLVWVHSKLIKDSQKIKYQDIIMCTSSGSAEIVGKVARADADWNGSFGAFCAGIRPNKKIINPSYLFHFLSSPEFKQWTRNSSGANIKNIRKSELEQFKIPLPSLEKQECIAAILDKADAIRRKRQQTINLTDQFLRSVFLELFGDPVTNPKGWGVVNFGSVGQLDRGKSKHRPRNDPILLDGDHPLIQTGDVANSGGYITEYKSTYSDVGLRQSKKWPAGTLCITIAANIANTGILEFDACFPDSIVGFTPNELVTVEYVQAWLGFLQKIIEDAAPESAQKNINLEILRGLVIPLPDIELQTKFSNIAHHVKSTKDRLSSGGDEIQTFFTSLTQRAFRGELSQLV